MSILHSCTDAQLHLPFYHLPYSIFFIPVSTGIKGIRGIKNNPGISSVILEIEPKVRLSGIQPGLLATA